MGGCACVSKKATATKKTIETVKLDESDHESAKNKKSKVDTSGAGGGVVIGSNNPNFNNGKRMSKDQEKEEQRRKQLEAAEKRMQENKTRGISQESLIDMQLREKRMKEAEKYKENEQYNLKWK